MAILSTRVLSLAGAIAGVLGVAAALAAAACATSSDNANVGPDEADANADGSRGSDDASDSGATDETSADASGIFTAPITLSDPTAPSFSPAIATRDGSCLVAWHELVDGGTRIAYVIVEDGVPGQKRALAEPLTGAKSASAATTTAGYVLTYLANDGTRDVVRAVELDATGTVTSGPDTISAPGAGGSAPRVAAAGAQEAFAWTTGTDHLFALRGPTETLAATSVGTTLVNQTVLNFPRIALDPSGTLFLAYRDGADTTTWEVYLKVRPAHGAFGAPANVSNSPGSLSDDVAVALESDGTLDVVWVDQDPVEITSFDVTYATRAPGGSIGAPAAFTKQHTSTWMPSVVPGLTTVWNGGANASGPFFLGSVTGGTGSVAPIVSPEKGNQSALGREPSGALDFAYADDATPKRIRFSRRP